VPRRLAVLAGALALVACGEEEPAAPPPAARTPTPNPTIESTEPAATPAPPGSAANAFIGSLAVDPADGTVFLGTGLGLFRARAGSERARKVVGELRTPDGSGPVSSNLVVRFAGPGELLASGHPNEAGELPENLGLMRSTDGGKSWEPVAALGEADYHVLQVAGERVVAVQAEAAEVEVSGDGGRTFEQRTPPAAPVDAAFDPRDPARMVVSTEQGLYTSQDEGGSWRQRDTIPESQLAWAAPDRLYRADPGGAVMVSGDGGASWEEAGSVDTIVNELAADAEGALYAAVPGGEVRRSVDGGATWALAVKLR
jgi:BNR/Asp-box repeat